MNNADESAYPRSGFTVGGDEHRNYSEAGFCNTKQDGLTKREYFAGLAMQGCLAYSYSDGHKGNWQNNSTPEGLAKASVEYADALLKELDQ